VVQNDVLRTIDSRDLLVYAVWEPILKTDDARSSRKATTLLPDSRVRNYWTGTLDLGRLFQPAIGLEGEPAWDVYLVYPPGIVWEKGAAPRPAFFMHQLGGRLPDARRLDGPGLAAELRDGLDRSRK
jgi:hypothetical protein